MGMQLMNMLYNLMDVFWMGRLSSESVAASSTAGMFLWMAAGVMLFGRVGAEIGVAQSLGAGDRDRANRYAQNALFICAVLGTTYALALLALKGPLIGFFNFKEQVVIDDSKRYLTIAALGLPFEFIFSVFSGTYNASGDSKTPFIAGTAGLITNMLLDPLLIFVLDMGISGAAISNVIGQLISFIIMLAAATSKTRKPFTSFKLISKPSLSYIKSILRWSIPSGMESIFFTTMSIFVMRFVAQFGSVAVTANKVGTQFESLTWMLGGGFGAALTAFIGQNYGAGKWTRIRKGYKISLILMALWGALTMLALIFFSAAYFGAFLPGYVEEIALGISFGQIICFCQIPQCIESVCASLFKGTGRTMPPFIVSASMNFIRMIAAYFLSQTSLGLYGVWIAISVGAFIRGLWIFVWSLSMLRKKPMTDDGADRLAVCN